MGQIALITCGDGLAVLAFTCVNCSGQVAFAVVARLVQTARALPPGVLNRAEKSVKRWGEPMRLVSMGELE
jgi:hypothetical protein